MCMFNVSLCAYGASVSCVCLSVYLGVIKVFFYTNIIKRFSMKIISLIFCFDLQFSSPIFFNKLFIVNCSWEINLRLVYRCDRISNGVKGHLFNIL